MTQTGIQNDPNEQVALRLEEITSYEANNYQHFKFFALR